MEALCFITSMVALSICCRILENEHNNMQNKIDNLEKKIDKLLNKK